MPKGIDSKTGKAIGFKDLTGKKIGKLEVSNQYKIDRIILPSGKKISKTHWLCLCECGKTKYVASAHLNNRAVQSCGCLQGVRNGKRLSNGEASFNYLYSQYKTSASKREIEFKLSIDAFKVLTKGYCYFCNQPPLQIARQSKGCNTGTYIYNGIDRLSSNLGYIVENCVPCCKICNYAKMELSEQDFLNHIKRIYNHSVKGRINE